MTEYNHEDTTKFSMKECEDAVGKKATLTLTGTIDEARDGPNGPFVMFRIEERWGFGDHRLGIDLDALTDVRDD